MWLSIVSMRGQTKGQSSMLCLVSPESVVPASHPIRGLKRLADAALARMSATFDAMYSETGRASIPPERLLKASLLMAFYSVRSERLLCEQLGYNLLFRWFLDMDMVEAPFDHSTFSRNRERLLEHDVAGEFFRAVIAEARTRRLMSDEHFTVDGTLIEAYGSLKSIKRKDDVEPPSPPDDPGNPTVNFRGERRTNETHASTTDPEARIAKKGHGKEAKLSHSAHALMENRSGLLVDLRVEEANGVAERTTALRMIEDALPGDARITLGADRGYDTREFVENLRAMNVTPHVARNHGIYRRSAIDERTTRHPGYAVSQRIRKRVEEIFGWCKTIGGLRRTRFVGRQKTQLWAHVVGAAYNLVRIARLTSAPA